MLHYSSTLGAWVADWRHPLSGRMHHLVAVKSGKNFWAYFDDQLVGSDYVTLDGAIQAAEKFAVGKVRWAKVRALASVTTLMIVTAWATSLGDASHSQGLKAAANPEAVAVNAVARAGEPEGAIAKVGPAAPLAGVDVVREATGAVVASDVAREVASGVASGDASAETGVTQMDRRSTAERSLGSVTSAAEPKSRTTATAVTVLASVTPPAAVLRPVELPTRRPIERSSRLPVEAPERHPVGAPVRPPVDMPVMAQSEYGAPFVPPAGVQAAPKPSSKPRIEQPRRSERLSRYKKRVGQRRVVTRSRGRVQEPRRVAQRRHRDRGAVAVQVRCYIGGRSERCWRRFRGPSRYSSYRVRCIVRGKSEWCRVGG